MKKLLLGTSALIGATAIVASASAAPELTISGNLDFRLVGGEKQATGIRPDPRNPGRATGQVDVGGEDRSWDFANGPDDRAHSVSEIKFRAHGEADSGATYGANIDYRYFASSTDEAYIFIADSWGRVHLGDDDGIVDGYVPRADSIAPGAYLVNGWTTSLRPRAVDTSDNTKITYHSAVANGFKFGVSLSETASISSGVHIFTPATPATTTPVAPAVPASLDEESGDNIGFTDVVEVGIGYASELYGVSYNLGLAYQGASVDDATKKSITADAMAISTTELTASADDLAEINVGFGLTWGDISVGGSYADAGDSGVVTASGNHITVVSFDTRTDTNGATVAHGTTSLTTAVNTANTNATAVAGGLQGQLSEGRTFYGIGASYDLGGGMAIGVSYGEATWSTYDGTITDAVRQVRTGETASAVGTGEITTAGQQARFNSIEHTQTLTTIDFGFPIMDGMAGYAGVALSEYEQAKGAGADGQAALSTDGTTYLVGTTVSF